MGKVKLSTLKLNPNNPRKISSEAMEGLKKSIRDFEKMLTLRPIVVDADGMVLGGNMRLTALRQLGYKEIPAEWVKVADDLTEDEKREFIIKDNPTKWGGEWDWDVLANEWDADSLADWGLEVPDWGKESAEVEDDEFEMPQEVKTNIVLGDLIEIGQHRLLCGDSTDSDSAEKLFNGKLADMILTDPPYGVDYTGCTKDALKIENDALSGDDLQELIAGSFNVCQLFSRPGSYWYATVPPGPLHLRFASDWNERGILRQIMVWVKDSLVLGHSEYHYRHEPILFGWMPGGNRKKNSDRTRDTVWEYARPKASREHPTMKPVELWGGMIKDGSNNGDLIYDPFLGSGTTIIAAHQLGRVCFGFELSPRYCQVIIDRMIKLDPSIEVKVNGMKYTKPE